MFSLARRTIETDYRFQNCLSRSDEKKTIPRKMASIALSVVTAGSTVIMFFSIDHGHLVDPDVV